MLFLSCMEQGIRGKSATESHATQSKSPEMDKMRYMIGRDFTQILLEKIFSAKKAG